MLRKPKKPQEVLSLPETMATTAGPIAGFKSSGEAALDSNGKSTGGIGCLNDHEGALRTFDRYRFQRHAAKILGWPEALSNCEWSPRHGVQSIEVWRNSAPDRGSWTRFVGLQTCKAVWTCPVCSNRRAWNRRQDLQKLVEYAQAQGLTLVMLTLTSRHNRRTALAEQRRMMAKAKSGMPGMTAFKKGIGKVLVGSVTATEVTHGERSGWHLHYHYILLLDLRHLPPEDREFQGQMLGESAWPVWRHQAEKAGLQAVRAAFSVEVGEGVARYPADTEKLERQWTLADEATRGAVKAGAGRHPFELLRLSCDQNDGHARSLFVEYAKAMTNKAALMWSRGLAALVGAESDEDEGEAEGGERQDAPEIMKEKSGNLDNGDWKGRDGRKGVRLRRGRMAVAVARDGTAGLERERDNDQADPTAAELATAADGSELIENESYLETTGGAARCAGAAVPRVVEGQGTGLPVPIWEDLIKEEPGRTSGAAVVSSCVMSRCLGAMPRPAERRCGGLVTEER